MHSVQTIKPHALNLDNITTFIQFRQYKPHSHSLDNITTCTQFGK